MVLSEDVLHVIVEQCHWIRNFPRPPRMQCFRKTSNFLLKNLSHRAVPIDPRFGQSPQVYRAWFLQCECKSTRLVVLIASALLPLCLTLHILQSSGMYATQCFTLNNEKVTKSSLSSAVWRLFLLMLQSSFPDHSEALWSHTQPRLCQPNV